jgi:hypothetical protein
VVEAVGERDVASGCHDKPARVKVGWRELSMYVLRSEGEPTMDCPG